MAKTNTIITIGRQFGSGGREIGYMVADKLGIKLYDKEMLQRAAQDSGICEELFESHDEKPSNSFLYSLVMDTYSMGYSGSTYNYYTDKRWGDADSYDVCLDSSVLGLEGTAEAIIKLIEVKEKGIKRNIWQYDE